MRYSPTRQTAWESRVNNSRVREWIRFLKSNQIVSTISEPVIEKLIYRKKVTAEYVIEFLNVIYNLDFASSKNIIRNAIPSIQDNS